MLETLMMNTPREIDDESMQMPSILVFYSLSEKCIQGALNLEYADALYLGFLWSQ